ncbi:MAG: ankyrin repeat domain-containing protein, partial [candidate division WOR-3 bacterium]
MNTIHKTFVVVLFYAIAVSAEADEIHDAALQGDIAKVKTLVAKDSTLVNARDEQENVVLHYAIFGRQTEIVEFLISKNADVHSVNKYNQNALLYAAYIGTPEIAELLLAKGAKLNEKDFLGRRPLHYAARQHKNVIELLLAHGADPNVTDNDGLTPLHTAVRWGRTDITMLLIASDADQNTLTSDGKTILHLASIKGYTALVELLVARGMNTDAKDNDGNTPLFYATLHDNKKVADLLKKHGATAEGLEKTVGSSPLLKKEFNDGEAAIWYLGHSAYAVKTKNHFLIFDYVEYTPLPDEPCLANGHINADEISDQNVYVFVTHAHSDHYDSTIFDWTKSVKNITYIFGWQAFEDSEYVYMGPRTAKRLDDLEIETIHSPEAGEPESN